MCRLSRRARMMGAMELADRIEQFAERLRDQEPNDHGCVAISTSMIDVVVPMLFDAAIALRGRIPAGAVTVDKEIAAGALTSPPWD